MEQSTMDDTVDGSEKAGTRTVTVVEKETVGDVECWNNIAVHGDGDSTGEIVDTVAVCDCAIETVDVVAAAAVPRLFYC